MRPSVTPPIASTGMRTAAVTRERASTPAGTTSGCVVLAQIGPKMTKSAPSRSASIAAPDECTERPTSLSPRSERASRVRMAPSGEFSLPPRLDAFLDRFGHQGRILGQRDRRVDEHGVGAKLHGEGGIRGHSDAGVNHDRHARLVDDDADLLERLQTLA